MLGLTRKKLAQTLVVGLAVIMQLVGAENVSSIGNMTLAASSSQCEAEYSACWWDSTCSECTENTNPQCGNSFRDCDGLWDVLCCMYGTTYSCLGNENLFNLVDCFHYEDTADCPARELCSGVEGFTRTTAVATVFFAAVVGQLITMASTAL